MICSQGGVEERIGKLFWNQKTRMANINIEDRIKNRRVIFMEARGTGYYQIVKFKVEASEWKIDTFLKRVWVKFMVNNIKFIQSISFFILLQICFNFDGILQFFFCSQFTLVLLKLCSIALVYCHKLFSGEKKQYHRTYGWSKGNVKNTFCFRIIAEERKILFNF